LSTLLVDSLGEFVMLRKSFIAATAVSALLLTSPAIARPTEGVWSRAPKAKRTKRVEKTAEPVQAPLTPGTATTTANNGTAPAATSQGKPANCTTDRPC